MRCATQATDIAVSKNLSTAQTMKHTTEKRADLSKRAEVKEEGRVAVVLAHIHHLQRERGQRGVPLAQHAHLHGRSCSEQGLQPCRHAGLPATLLHSLCVLRVLGKYCPLPTFAQGFLRLGKGMWVFTRSVSRSWGHISEMVTSVRPGCARVARSSFLLRCTRSDRLTCARTLMSGPKETTWQYRKNFSLDHCGTILRMAYCWCCTLGS